jgi:hypothetical protein
VLQIKQSYQRILIDVSLAKAGISKENIHLSRLAFFLSFYQSFFALDQC